MKVESSDQQDSKSTPGTAPAAAKKRYHAPVLTEFGHVTALTQSASCVGDNDSTTTGSCVPGNRAMDGSDRSLKTDVVRIGTHPQGFGLYLFSYKPEYQALWGAGRQFGVMADEVEQVMPQAVARHEDGYRLVCYEMLGIRRALH